MNDGVILVLGLVAVAGLGFVIIQATKPPPPPPPPPPAANGGGGIFSQVGGFLDSVGIGGLL